MSFEKPPEDDPRKGKETPESGQDSPGEVKREREPESTGRRSYQAAPGALESEPEGAERKPEPPAMGGAPRPRSGGPGQPPHRQEPPPGYQPRPGGPPPQYGGPAQRQGPPAGGPPRQGPPPGFPPPFGGGPGGGYPQPPRQRNRVLPIVIGLVILLFIGSVAVIGLVVSSVSRPSTGPSLGIWGSKIGVINLDGVIISQDAGPGYVSSQRVVDQINRWQKNDNIRAIVLRINSPGGGVSATQDIFHALNDYRDTGRNVYAHMGDVAASGGYLAAMACDEVYANEGTLTGSIGVIISFFDFQGLQEKIGIRPRSIKSGEFKDIGSGSRDMTEAERELLQELIDDVFEQFIEVVIENRREPVRRLLASNNGVEEHEVSDEAVVEHLRYYSDGRIFSGRQAASYAMIDGTMTYEDLLAHVRQQEGMAEGAGTVEAEVRRRGFFGSITGLMKNIERLAPAAQGVHLEYRFAP